MIGEKRWKRWCRQFRWLRGCPGNAKCSTCPSYECNVYMRSQLMSHERSKLHTSKGASACPDVKEFGQIIQERQNGVSLRRSEHEDVVVHIGKYQRDTQNSNGSWPCHCIYQSRWSRGRFGCESLHHQLPTRTLDLKFLN